MFIIYFFMFLTSQKFVHIAPDAWLLSIVEKKMPKLLKNYDIPGPPSTQKCPLYIH